MRKDGNRDRKFIIIYKTGIWLLAIRISFFCWKKKLLAPFYLGSTAAAIEGDWGDSESEDHSFPGVCQGIKKRILRESSTKRNIRRDQDSGHDSWDRYVNET